MGDGEISVRSDVFFTFYFLLSTLYFLFSGEEKSWRLFQLSYLF
ncbi:MAG: hypothetical protein AB1422_12620 [bacterium]